MAVSMVVPTWFLPGSAVLKALARCSRSKASAAGAIKLTATAGGPGICALLTGVVA